MIALALSLTVLTATPRGFPAAHSIELLTQVESRLPRWLTGEGDRKDLLANPKELEKFIAPLGPQGEQLKTMVTNAVNEQAELPELKTFTASKVLIQYDDRQVTVSYFDANGHRCVVPLLAVGTEAKPRYLLLDGPRTDERTIQEVLEGGRAKSMMVFAEKKDGAWSTGSMPAPPPPDCTMVLKKALKTLFTAEKAYFAEHDAYSNSLTKIGVDAKTLGITSAKVSVAGAAPQQTFTIQVGLDSGLMKMDDKGTVSIVADCAH
ncbi:MAG: hypothetical protein Q8N23_29820 [Archangium sp.]|nr:hypothetical protein [Archangium sp.]MDP3575586.1 hypothetical protein [Archangium sp.]